MSVIFILIAFSLLLASGFLLAFLWAARTGQFEDDYTPSIRMLFEDGISEVSNSLGSDGIQQKSEAKKKKGH